MRILKYVWLVFVCCLTYLVTFLALNNFQSEGTSFKTCVLMAMPLFIWMVYQRISVISEKLRVSENYKVTIRRMQEQITFYDEMTRMVGGSRLMKGIHECREVAQALMRPGAEDTSLTLHRLAYIERLMNDMVPGICRRMSDRERQMWARVINEFPAIPVHGAASADNLETTSDDEHRNG